MDNLQVLAIVIGLMAHAFLMRGQFGYSILFFSVAGIVVALNPA